MVNRPSDNYGADVVVWDLGAQLEGEGSGAAGALAVTETMRPLGLHPQMVSGSGESVEDRDSPRDIVDLLRLMHQGKDAADFASSLTQAGRQRIRHRLRQLGRGRSVRTQGRNASRPGGIPIYALEHQIVDDLANYRGWLHLIDGAQLGIGLAEEVNTRLAYGPS